MKYKQVCPECFFELIISDINDKVKKCPNCNRREIANQKLIRIEDAKDECVTINDDVATDSPVTPWSEFEDSIETTKEDANILFKYVSGVINSDFEMTVSSKDGEIIFGRSAMGQEYFQYDNRISNEHFHIKYEDGNWLIRDNYSTNGTLINGNLLEPSREYELKTGDIITLGKTSSSAKLEVHVC